MIRFAPGGVLAGTIPYPSLPQGLGFGLARGVDREGRRLGPASEVSERVDILEAHGKLRAVLRLPARRRLISLGAAAVYLLATDEDGLQTLERYAYPRLPG